MYRTGEGKELQCSICRERVERDSNGNPFMPCDCGFPVCRACYEFIREQEGGRCPQCHEQLKWMKGSPKLPTDPAEETYRKKPMMIDGQGAGSFDGKEAESSDAVGEALLSMQILDPAKNMQDYGYGSVHWGEGEKREGRDNRDLRTEISVEESKRPLSRTLPIPNSLLQPYRLMVLLRGVVLALFLRFRLTTPNYDAFVLWVMSVSCEVWFGFSWILDQTPKWSPVTRETYLDRLSARFESGPVSKLLPIDVFVTTADVEKEPPLVTANVILSILAIDYPAEQLACYLSDDGSAMLMFETMTETASFARAWVPFCKKHEIEPRCPEMYFSQKFDYTKGKTSPDFIKERRHMKRAYDEFKVRINALVAKSKNAPAEGWRMADGSMWPGNKRSDHVGMIQVFLQPDGETKDLAGKPLPRLVYVSREKRPGYDHNKKAGAMNALMRASGLISNGPFILNLDCDHYVNNSKALREAMCFLMDPNRGHKVCYVQFPQRFDGVDKNDRYANHNTVFFDVNMKGLDGAQGPCYVGTGCCFRRQALYGFVPQRRGEGSSCCCCWPTKRKASAERNLKSAIMPGDRDRGRADRDERDEDHEDDDVRLIPTQWHAKRFGACPNFVATVVDAEGGVPDVDPYQVLSDVILVISCGYEDDTEWGKTVGWMYGSVTEDIVTGYNMHVNGWYSVYCMPKRSAFKGTAPINLTDRLGQVLRWALGSVEIFFSRHNPIVFNWCKHLNFMQRMSRTKPNHKYRTRMERLRLTSSGVTLEEWWRNEQFWVIGGTSAHIAAVVQGLLKVVAGVDTSFTLTAKGADEEDEFAELYAFRFTWLMVPPLTIIIINVVAIFAGVSREMYQKADSQNWGKLMGMCFFSVWVLTHMYPFMKGMMGKSQKTPTIVIVWSILLAIILSLLWVRMIT
ncbi:hypothetical protein CBR_g22266 [Chara braunii]|uniref:Cellulose synthase n=1 Tax=Chara braunii TaxID=69332 RepID=A0A388L2N5_CHABU|nr:hypothetical protein CBR_g22266 [Chara braunii]|eukprot:GBG76518.1 hypothetical protein CBR_g22266 [Chara braunii]